MAGKKTRLETLDCFPEVRERLMVGDPPEEIATWIQDDQNEYDDVSHGAVVRALYRFQKSMPALQEKKEITVATMESVQRRLESTKEGISEVDELMNLYFIQMTRIDQGLAIEDRIKIPRKELREDIKEAKDILVKLADLKMNLGVLRKEPERVEISDSRLPEGMSPEQRKRLGEAAKLFINATVEGKIEEADFEVIEAEEEALQEQKSLGPPRRGGASEASATRAHARSPEERSDSGVRN